MINRLNDSQDEIWGNPCSVHYRAAPLLMTHSGRLHYTIQDGTNKLKLFENVTVMRVLNGMYFVTRKNTNGEVIENQT